MTPDKPLGQAAASHCDACRAAGTVEADHVIARGLTVEASKLYFRIRLVALIDEISAEDS